jgi:ketosteroid isomerase-like protein
MRKSAVLCALFLAAVTAVPAIAAPPDDVLAAIRGYREALVQKDVAKLETIWSDDYTFVNGHGRLLTKADRIADIKSGHSSLDSVRHEDTPTVTVHGNTVLVLSHVTLVGKYSGREVSGEFRSLHVWLKNDGRWQLVFNQLTPMDK